MAFDYSKLKGRIAEVCGTRAAFATAMGMSEKTMVSKLSGQTPWKQTDICKAIEVLSLDCTDIPAYFFNAKVQ